MAPLDERGHQRFPPPSSTLRVLERETDLADRDSGSETDRERAREKRSGRREAKRWREEERGRSLCQDRGQGAGCLKDKGGACDQRFALGPFLSSLSFQIAFAALVPLCPLIAMQEDRKGGWRADLIIRLHLQTGSMQRGRPGVVWDESVAQKGGQVEIVEEKGKRENHQPLLIAPPLLCLLAPPLSDQEVSLSVCLSVCVAATL